MANLQGDAWHEEQRRKAQDLIRVYNPTDVDYVLTLPLDRQQFIIPNKNKDMGWGNGMRVIQRYLAEKYCREMKDKLVFEEADKKLQNIKDMLAKQGASDIPFNANMKLDSMRSEVRSDETILIEKWYNILWLGLEQEFGMDDVAPLAQGEKFSQTESDVFDKLANKRYTPPSIESDSVSQPTAPEAPKRGRPAKADLSEVAA